MVTLDIAVVNVALPSIDADLGFAAGDLQWVITAYVLFTGGLLLLGGRATDLFGRRRVFLTGLAVFTAASLASGLAPSPEALIVDRAAPGLGAAMLSPAALSIGTTYYSGPSVRPRSPPGVRSAAPGRQRASSSDGEATKRRCRLGGQACGPAIRRSRREHGMTDATKGDNGGRHDNPR